MEATNKSGEIVPLQYTQANEAVYTLVIYLAPDGNNKDQVKYMHKKETAWSTSIRSGGVQQNKLWKSFNSTIPQTIKYPLASMTLNKKECKHIMQTIVNFGLTKAGIISTLHTAVRYGPWSLEGFGVFDPFIIQWSGQITFLVEPYFKFTPYIPLLWDNLYNLQLESGRGGVY